ncbi:MAG TPA: FUSC family protein, partial [Segetibacter sp.]
FGRLLHQQVVVQQKQTELTELLFKTRSIVRESTNIGRTLVMVHLEVAEIFEKIIMSHQQYSHLHKFFDDTDILEDFHLLARRLAHELSEAGLAIKSGYTSLPGSSLADHIQKTSEKLDNLRLTYLNPDNIEGFISLRRILENISDLANRSVALHKYTSYNTRVKKKMKQEDFERMIAHQEISAELFINNLSLKSDTFRHSLRVSVAVISGYVISLLFHIGHIYWVLLTIIVILKPAFSLTKKRNGDRLAGTILGVLIGIILLYFIQNSTVLLILLIIFMAASYSFMRVNYFVMVLLMTPYLILFYHLLNPADFTVLLKDRIIDTIIGSAIAFIASFFLFPSWEREKIKPVMAEMLTEVQNYFSVTASVFNGESLNIAAAQLARKNTLVALANLSDAFSRMLAEPKSQQKGIGELHQFVVLNHMLTSYIATLSHYIRMPEIPYTSANFSMIGEEIRQYLAIAIERVNAGEATGATVTNEGSLQKLNEQVNELLHKRQLELQQGLIETETRKPLFNLKSIV